MERVDKPWGYELILCDTGKILRVEEENILSKQKDEKRDKTLYLVRGTARICIDGDERVISNIGSIYKGQTIDIPHNTEHSIEALESCIFIELSTLCKE